MADETTLYYVEECNGEVDPFIVDAGMPLIIGKVYSFVEFEKYCFTVIENVKDGTGIAYEVSGEFDSCAECKGEEPTFAEIIIEDDVNLKVSRTMTANEPLFSVKSSIIITNGTETHALYSYTLPFDQVYTGGYLDYNALIELPWNENFPSGAINNKAEIKTTSNLLELRLPNIINWREFQTLPQLAIIFGVDATNNWLWYQQNGWQIKQRVELRNDIGLYVDDYGIVVRDYDDRPTVLWDWKFYRVSDNAPLTAPISNGKTRVVVTAIQPSSPAEVVDYSTVTVEGIEKPTRWLISSFYDQLGQSQSPLQPLTTETKLKFNATSLDVILEFIFDPSKLDGQDGVKFTARNYQVNVDGLYTERNVIEFPIVRIPEPPLSDEYDTDCCECLPELKLASSTSEELIKNDITGVAHKNQTYLDTCEFKIFKGSQLLTNNGVDYPNGFPHDPNVSSFVFNWKWYLVNHGMGCYKIEKHFTIAGLPMIEEIGKYELLEYTPENAQGTVRVLYQNDFQTLWEDTTINYAGSGFEDSYRFRGMFGRWQPNVMSESNFSVLNENRVASIKSKDTYLLNHFQATECHIKRLHKIVMHAAIWRMSDHNPSNTLQEKKIYECVLDPESKEDITYNAGSRVTGIEIVLSKRQQNSVSLFSGSIQTPKGATWLLPTVQGGAGTCLPSPISIAGTYINDLPSGDSLNIITTDQNDVPITPISGTVSGGVATVILPDEVYNIYFDNFLNETFTAPAMSDLTINIIL